MLNKLFGVRVELSEYAVKQTTTAKVVRVGIQKRRKNYKVELVRDSQPAVFALGKPVHTFVMHPTIYKRLASELSVFTTTGNTPSQLGC